MLFLLSLPNIFLNAQPTCNDCKPTGGPTYKCISGNVSDLITSGDLLPYTSALTTPQYVVIDANLVIDVPYAFTNSSVMIVLHDKGIKVNTTVGFSIHDSEIRGCSYLWNGILLENNSNLWLKNSVIRDAKHAVHLNNSVDQGVALTIDNCEFRANYVSLNISRRKFPATNFDSEIAIYREKGIVANDFYLDELLLPDYQNVISDDYPKTGIYLKDLSEMEIGGYVTYTGDNNTFVGIGPCPGVLCDDDPIQTAIVVYRTNAKIRKTKIDDIIYAVRGVGPLSFPIKGIQFDGLGTSGGSPLTMENVRNAFDMIAIGLIVNGAKIQQGGIKDNKLMDFKSESFLAGIYKTQITNNVITSASPPTIYFNEYAMNNGLVQNNEISVTNLGYWGEVIGSHFSSIRKNNLNIRENDIELASGGSQSSVLFKGIHLSNNERPSIARNNIEANTSSNGGNIVLDNCEKLWVFKNYIYPTTGLQTATGALGLKVYETRNCTYSCNSANNLRVGLQYSGDCLYSDVQNNIMIDDYRGLYLGQQFNTQIGKQPNRQNRWFGTNTYTGGYEAIAESPLPAASHSKFYVPQATSSDFWPDPYTPTDWFANTSGPSGYPNRLKCLDTIYGHEPHGPGDVGIGGNLVEIDDDMIAGIYNPDSIYGASMIRDAEFQLYDKLVNYPDLITSSSASEAWFDSMEVSNLGIIYSVDQTVRNMGTLVGTDESTFNNFQDSIELMEAYIQLLHDAIHNETNSTVKDSLIAIRVSATSDLIDLNERSLDFYNVWQDDKMSDASDALVDITGVSPLNTWETNFAIMLRIQLESIINEQWLNYTMNQMDSLESVAEQCRYLGGISVVRARGITMGLAGFEVDEDNYCDPRSTANVNQVVEQALPLEIFPNPATNTVNVMLPKEVGTFRLVLRDMLGKKYHDFYIQGNGEAKFPIYLDQLSSGMYSIQLFSPDSKMYSTTLSVHK